MAKAKKKAKKKAATKAKKTTKKKVKRAGASGRPQIGDHGVKAKINISIDPDVKLYLDKLDSRSPFVNDALRAAVAKAKAKRGKKAGNKTKRKSARRASASA